MVQSIERAVEIMSLVADQPTTPAELARRLDVHRSTVLRLVLLLKDHRYLRKLSNGAYAIGPEIVNLASRAAEQFRLAPLAHPMLQQFSSKYSQAVHLAELQGDQIVYIDKVNPSSRPIQLTSRIGGTVSLHTASVAKAILAYQPAATIAKMFSGYTFERLTGQTITSLSAFRANLDLVRRRGWSDDQGENEEYINAIGVPIHNASGAVIAAVSAIDLKAVRSLSDMENQSLAALKDCADQISVELGWHPDDTSTGTRTEENDADD